jgi:integrase
MTKRRGPGDGGLYKRADGLWIGVVDMPTADGKRRRRTVSSKSRAEAARKLNELKAAVAAGQVTGSPRMTVAQWLDYWLEDICRYRVRPTTLRYYEGAIRLYVKPQLGGRRLADLSQADVRAMHRALQADSTRAAVKAHQTLQKSLADAVREGIIPRNVAALTEKPKHVVQTRGALTMAQARQLVVAALEAGDPLASRWAAALLLGARQGELLGLEWSRVDLDAGLVDLSWQLQLSQKAHGCDGDCGRQRPGFCPSAVWNLPPGVEYRECYKSLIWTRPKTSAGTRVVPVIAPLLLLLREHAKATAGQPNPHGLVWHHADGRPLYPSDDQDSWSAALARADIEHVPLHVARHTTATLLMEAGVPEDVRMQIMGHNSVVAQRGYVHVDQSLTRKALLELESLLPGGEN